MSPTVVHIVPTLYDDSGRIAGGAERYAFELAREMAETVPTRLVSFGPADDRSRHGRLSVRIIGGARAVGGQAANPWAKPVLREILRAGVVHCHQRDVFVAKAAATVRRTVRRPVFVTDHGGGVWDFTSRLGVRAPFDGHLHVSAFSRRVSGQEHDPRARVVYAGVNLKRFSPPGGAGARERVLFVGRLLPHKGVDVLIEALPDGIGLDVAGPVLDERYRRDLGALAEGRDVRFHHGWDDARVREAYRAALCIVLPSVHRDRYGGETAVPELLGQTLLEGMACGAPAICTDAGGMPEVVADGETGYVVEPNDPGALGAAIARVAADRALAARLGEAALAHVRGRFSWSEVARRCLEAYGPSTSER